MDQSKICCSAALAALLALAGCTVGPDYQPPEVQLPDAWRVAIESEFSDAEPDIATWWEAFGDEVLTDLILRAGLANLDLARALARVEEARASYGIARGARFPSVSVDGAYARTRISENSATGQSIDASGGDFDTDEWGFSGSSSWEVDVFGRVRRAVEAAHAAYEASIEDQRDVRVTLYAEVGLEYVELRATQARLAIAESNARAQRDSVQLTRDRFDAGLTSALDVAQAEQNLAQTESTIPELESALNISLNRLAVLLGLPAGALAEELAREPRMPAAPATITAGVPADLLRRRPDIRRAERALAAETAAIGVATADLYPTFSISGFVESVAENAGDLVDDDSLGWGIVPGFRWDLFRGGAIRSGIEAQEARAQQALLAYRQTILLALEEVHDTLVAFDRESVRRDRLEEAVLASERAVDLVRTQYRSGLTNFQNLLDTQRSLFRQQDLLAVSDGRVVQNLIALNRALGGGWSVDEETP